MKQFNDHILPFFEKEQFIQWVTHPDKESNAYWESWMLEHLDQVNTLLEAKEMAALLLAAERPLSVKQLSYSIWENIYSQLEEEQPLPPIQSHSKRFRYQIAAAVIGLFLIVSGALYFGNKSNSTGQKEPLPAVANILQDDTLNRINSTTQNQIAYLVDGTKVTLQPGSSIKHRIFLQKNKREIFLRGDAFFEVAKDPHRPFFVYTHNIVLKVLGTSFNVTTDKLNGNVTVVVKTGKVSVYKNNSPDKEAVILTPNQRILFTAQSQLIEKSDLESASIPLNTKLEARAINFNFDETPVSNIFGTLEEGYGVKINYDPRAFSKCIVTTSLTDEPFEEKLKIICAAIGANYTLEKNQVFITGSGCK